MALSVSVFDAVVVAESATPIPFGGRAIFSSHAPVFSHRPFTNQGMAIYLTKTNDSDKVEIRRFRAIFPRFLSMGVRTLDFGKTPIQKGSWVASQDFPNLTFSMRPFVAGDDGDWWILALPHGEDIETVRSTTGFECLHALKLTGSGTEPPTKDNEVPNTPSLVSIQVRAFGVLRLNWLYDPTGEAIAASVFRVFHDSGTGTVDYSTVRASVNFQTGQFSYFTDLTFQHAQVIKFSVRSETAGAVRETNTNTISGTADAKGPPAATNLTATGECD